MNPHQLIGQKVQPFSATAERGQLAFFARTIGLDDPVYSDIEAARAAGHRDLPLPPTFLFSLEMLRPEPHGALAELGIDMRSVLHGEQSFDYHATAYAGDVLNFAGEFIDYYEKKNGTLRFLLRRTDVTRAGEPIATLTNTLISRQLDGLNR